MPNSFPILVGGTAPEPSTGDYLVRFIDFDGTILKEQWVNAGQAATAPTPPTHQYLTFDEWNNTFTNVQHDLDVGAAYYTTDGKTYLFMRFTNTTGLQPAIYLYKADTSLMTINWGDGTSQTTSASGNVTITKTNPYAAIGDYTITIECAGNWLLHTYIFNNYANYNSCLLECYLGESVTNIGTYAFSQCFSLKSIVIPKNIITIKDYAFYACFSLQCIIIPDGIFVLNNHTYRFCRSLSLFVIPKSVTTINIYALADNPSLTKIIIPDYVIDIGYYCFQYCYNLQSIVMPSGLAGVWVNLFYQCYNLSSIIIPDAVTVISSFSFYLCYKLTSITIPFSLITIGGQSVFENCSEILQYLCLPTSPPTLASTTSFTGINKICKIYVPDASVSAYQAATNWVTYASYIYPISELTEYAGTIFFQSNGGNAIKQITGTVGAVATEPTAPTKTGFTFAGWYKEAALTNAWNWASDVYPSTNITLYAKWV